jgi:hypothetical protein
LWRRVGRSGATSPRLSRPSKRAPGRSRSRSRYRLWAKAANDRPMRPAAPVTRTRRLTTGWGGGSVWDWASAMAHTSPMGAPGSASVGKGTDSVRRVDHPGEVFPQAGGGRPSPCGRFEELEVRSAWFPPRTRLKMVQTGATRPNSKPAWARGWRPGHAASPSPGPTMPPQPRGEPGPSQGGRGTRL